MKPESKPLPKSEAEKDDARREADASEDAREEGDGYEACYADGSLQNECWNARREDW